MSKAHAAILSLVVCGQAAVAEESLWPQDFGAGQSALSNATGMLMLDYEQITLTDGGAFDLFGVSYLHQLNDWLYSGVGFSAPMIEGNYGGFFAGGVTLHAQKEIFGNWFVDAGVSFGAGAGGASVSHIRELSGSGAYFKKYAGIGYSFGGFNLGVNYASVKIADSLIDDSMINFFFQAPLSFPVGSYSDAGRRIGSSDFSYLGQESMISFEYSNLSQIDPTGKYGGNIGLVSPQFSQFYSDDYYWFLGLDLGYSGLVWYNQAQGGIGRRFALTPNINLYGQLGVGSGGWVTDTIDTGPGLVIYPKVKAEYKWGNGIGAFVSAGYLFAPMATSKNWSLGVGINYHLPGGRRDAAETANETDLALRGLRVSLLGRKLFDIAYNGGTVDDLNLIGVQVDYAINDNWYVPFQVVAATNDFRGFAGYVEGFAGLGWQTDLFASDKLRGFAQVMYGMNDVGIDAQHDVGALLYPSVGLSYDLSDRYSVYGQFGKTLSLGKYMDSNFTNSFEGTTVGFGLTYRFSAPTHTFR